MVSVTLALGLGANAALFSILDRMFLQAPPAVAAPGQLRRVFHSYKDSRGNQQILSVFAPPEFLALTIAVPAGLRIGLSLVIRGLCSPRAWKCCALYGALAGAVLGHYTVSEDGFAKLEFHGGDRPLPRVNVNARPGVREFDSGQFANESRLEGAIPEGGGVFDTSDDVCRRNARGDDDLRDHIKSLHPFTPSFRHLTVDHQWTNRQSFGLSWKQRDSCIGIGSPSVKRDRQGLLAINRVAVLGVSGVEKGGPSHEACGRLPDILHGDVHMEKPVVSFGHRPIQAAGNLNPYQKPRTMRSGELVTSEFDLSVARYQQPNRHGSENAGEVREDLGVSRDPLVGYFVEGGLSGGVVCWLVWMIWGDRKSHQQDNKESGE